MRIIKLGLISLLFFSLLITLISFLFPSHVHVSRAINIHAGKDSVMAQLKEASHWKKWFPGADSMAPFVQGDRVVGIATEPGQEWTITQSTDSSVSAVLIGPRSSNGTAGWNVLDVSDTSVVTVQWYIDFHLRWYPWEKFSGLLLEKRYCPLMEKGLTALKAMLEK